MNLKKMQNLSDKYVAKFNKAATELVMDEVTGTDDENKKIIIMFTARDMAIGAVMKRSEHILTGLAIGIGATALTIGIVNKIKKIKNEVVSDMVRDSNETVIEMNKHRNQSKGT